MKNITKILFLLTLTIFVVSCSNDEEDEIQKVSFAGTWSGTFSGGDSGTWSATVNSDGTISGQAFSNNIQTTVPLNGTIDTSGELRASLGTAENGAAWSGNFTDEASSGSWENNADNISGTWEGTKK